ncbi:MAG TPA: glycosyltransferase family 39 protein [Chthoniobacterales bacterium]|nr:glycosyltransferase family 39 protein [Chthoniobacterales bacterium]
MAGVLAAVLIFTNLGGDYLWEDEGDTAVLAENILRFGVPKAWDGVSFNDSDRGARLNRDLVMVSHPWLQYYLAATSFAVFKESNWAARFPFALSGWLTVLVIYACVYDVTKNRSSAFCAATLLTASIQFLLYCRQCRYYSTNMLLSVLLVWVFFRLKTPRSGALFAIVSILLFHSDPFGIVLVGAVALTSFLSRSFASERRFLWWTAPIIAILTLPWIIFARFGYAENSQLVRSPAQFAGRLVQYLIECASVTPLIGLLVLGLIYWIFSALRPETADGQGTTSHNSTLSRNELGLFLVTIVALICYDAAIAVTESSDDLWRIGIRHATAMLPLVSMATAVLMIKISRSHGAIWVSLLLLFIFTKAAQLTPWVFWERKVASFDGKEVIEAHLPQYYLDRYLNLGQQLAFLRDLRELNPGTLAKTCQFLHQHAAPGDIVLTNYEWDPLYFHTRLPQALKIFPDYPIYQTARAKGLPEYVFDIDHVRWVIWRPIWEGYVGYFGDKISRQILDRGARVTREAQFEETIWENRPEIHLHRFAGNKYFFTAPENQRPAEIFEIHWPESH